MGTHKVAIATTISMSQKWTFIFHEDVLITFWSDDPGITSPADVLRCLPFVDIERYQFRFGVDDALYLAAKEFNAAAAAAFQASKVLIE